jgi:hypothetical protein
VSDVGAMRQAMGLTEGSEAGLDLMCRCRGICYPQEQDPCEERADGEDGLCKHCRVSGGRCCENFSDPREIQLARAMDQQEAMRRGTRA